jgi:acyl-CoA thioesterase I
MRYFAALVPVILCFSTVVQAQIKIACVGNSVTAGAGLSSPSLAYPAKLQALLGKAYTVKNEGVSGTTMTKTNNSPYWKTNQFKDVFTFKPNIISIALGTNDAWWGAANVASGAYKSSYLSMIDSFGTISTKPKIYLILPTHFFKDNSANTRLLTLIEQIKQIGVERGLPVVDFYSALGDTKYFQDGVHPTAAGADSLSKVLYKALSGTTGFQAWPPMARVAPKAPSLVPVFPGGDYSAIFRSLTPGQQYDIRVFDDKGALLSRENVVGSASQQMPALSTFRISSAMRWVSVRTR